MNDKVGLDIIRSISSVLDKAVYWIISIAYEIITELAQIDIFKDTTVSDFSTRIYTLIGLFMIFKISFVLINYVINPGNITDKEKGGANLIKRIVITFVLIIMAPQLFSLMTRAQNAILDDKILERFILGQNDAGEENYYLMDERCEQQAQAESTGDYISLLIFRPFFQLEDAETFTSVTEGENILNSFANSSGYCRAVSVKDILKPDIYNSPSSGFGIYRVNYWFIISSLVGGVVAILMVTFCMDIAVRSIKLGFLQIISPVPIMSYIDPSQSKGGMLKKWATEVGKTWADLFVRLGALYLAIYIISSLDNIWDVSSSTDYKYWVFVFLIIGALMFAKKLPSIIESVFGIKLSGAFKLNPLKKFQDEALGGKDITKYTGKALAGTGALALGTMGSIIANNRTKKALQDMQEKVDDKDKKLDELKRNYLQRLRSFQGTPTDKKSMMNDYLTDKNKLDKERREELSKLNEKKEDLRGKFSYEHPVMSGATEIARSVQKGFEKGGKNITEVLNNAFAASKYAAELRNKNDTFNNKARFEDFLTDISGVKNSSGTTSEIKGAIKQQTEQLTDLSNAINSLNTSIAYVNQTMPGAIGYDSATGKAKVNDSYDFAGKSMSKDQIQQFLDDISTLRKSQQEGNKSLNSLNDMLKSKEKK
ncbi:MAG: hypothetical protein PHN42_03980 [Bacilli bacterium]|nr:hypothetical protein [Bacilli bacterium]